MRLIDDFVLNLIEQSVANALLGRRVFAQRTRVGLYRPYSRNTYVYARKPSSNNVLVSDTCISLYDSAIGPGIETHVLNDDTTSDPLTMRETSIKRNNVT